ncbi:MAG TPA: Gfo/Idh/MocA family oxidoreductase [Candidatus Limnocylindrales bacterium]|jgi:predicted dehydrogenase
MTDRVRPEPDAPAGPGSPGGRLRVGIVGGGDVAHRHYLPALESLRDVVALGAVVDPREGAAEAVASAVADWSPGAEVYRDVEAMLAGSSVDGVFNLTPAPFHGSLNRAILEAGIPCYSEKPIAASVPEADALIDLAAKRGVLLLCAPGSAVTNRIRWLRDLAVSERFGRPTLAVAHHADPGPADWDEYTGDPTPFYREGVGPVFDHGVYRLHEMTTVLGPVRRVQAMGSLALPRRRVRGGPLRGRTIEVTTQDHVLIHLEFVSGALGQLLASFATADTLAPWLEMHFAEAVVSFGGKSWEPDAPVSIYDASRERREDWRPAVEMPADDGVVEAGARHFIRCLLGDEQPILTAEHARHVLEVILAAYEAMADGRTHEIETTFAMVATAGAASAVGATAGG